MASAPAVAVSRTAPSTQDATRRSVCRAGLAVRGEAGWERGTSSCFRRTGPAASSKLTMRASGRAREAGRMLLRRLAVPALLVPTVLAAAGQASAAGGLEPGGSETLSIQLPSSWARQADQLGISVVGLFPSENGCLVPEIEAGDSTCGADGGDLAGQLIADVAAGQPDDGTCRATTPWVHLDLLHPAGQSRIAVSSARCLVIRLSFPSDGDDNVAQSDALSFDVRTVAEGPDAGVAVAQTPMGATPRAGAASVNRGRAAGTQQVGTVDGPA